MENIEREIRPLEAKDCASFFSYLNHHLSGNGKDGTPLFQPVSRSESKFPKEKVDSFTEGLVIPVVELRWRRAWIAVGENGEILAHIDLRALAEPNTEHRALLGMGVHTNFRGRGIGTRPIAAVETWVKNSTRIEIIDLWVLSRNKPAIALYRSTGFEMLGEIEDMFRIDGISESHTLMSKGVE
jgi:RimJ/RimL family protein N-acetyltransferase